MESSNIWNEEDDITNFKLKNQDRVYKHYELRKAQDVETNPSARVVDAEKNVVENRAHRVGPRAPVQHRPSTRFEEHARVGFGDKKHSRGPSESQKEEINALKKELVDTQFLDESIRWKIIDIKWNGKYKKIMVHYYDMDQFDDVPSSPKNQEYTPIVVIRKILQENNL